MTTAPGGAYWNLSEAMSALIVLTTFPDQESARRAARELVEQRVAACVSLLPGVESYFHWQGKLDQAQEILVLCKTTPGAWPALREALAALHPYEVPEILAVPVEAGLPAYLDWLSDSCGAMTRGTGS